VTDAGSSQSTGTDASLRVLSYNLRYAGIDEGPIAWERRRERVASVIDDADPDLLALQECWLDQLDDLRERLPAYDWIGFADQTGEHTPIGYRRERLAVVEADAFGLAPDGERGVPGWDGEYPRTVTRARFRRKRSAPTDDDHSAATAEFTLFSIHLDNRGERARREGARTIRDRLPSGPVVVAGDCNCLPDSEPYETFTRELTDTARAARRRSGPAETYVGFGGAAVDEEDDPTPRRLDYVFCRGVAVDAHCVLSHDGDPTDRPSDHRPVVVDVTLPESTT
jgi:endonuclease/exonuclease/phosphatase family metal-dependent hydrolase